MRSANAEWTLCVAKGLVCIAFRTRGARARAHLIYMPSLPPHYGAAVFIAASTAAVCYWQRNILITDQLRSAHTPPVVIVGGWSSSGTSVFELGSLSRVGRTLSLGSFSEAVVALPGTCTLAAGSSLCCDGSTPAAYPASPRWTDEGGMGTTAECAVDCALRSATFTFSHPAAEYRSFVATTTGMTPSYGQAPDALAHHPAGKLLVANFGGNPPFERGGNSAILSWRKGGYAAGGAASLVAASAAASPVLHPTSHIHHVATDPSCGTDAYALLTDAGPFSIIESPVWAIHIINAHTAALEDSVMMPMRPRSITLHPTLPVAYVIYELAAKVGVWSWPRCSKWRRPFDVAATPATAATASLPARPKELQQLSTSALGTGPPLTSGEGWAGPAAPTRALLSPHADLLHVCGRNRPTGEIATFAVGTDGQLSLVGFTATAGTDPRECALSPSGDTLLEVDTDRGTLAAYDVSTSGRLQRTKLIDGLEQPNTLLVWAPPAQCYSSAKE